MQVLQKQQPDAQQQVANTLMARLINLAAAALRAGSVEKAANIIVNQMNTLVRTDRTMLVPLKGKKRILCVSGDLDPNQDTPFAQAVHEIRSCFKTLILQESREPQIISQENLPDEFKGPNARKLVESMGGTSILWIPLFPPGDETNGFALWMERWNKFPWNPEEIKLISHAAVFFDHALVSRKKRSSSKIGKKLAIAALTAFMLLMWVPIHSRINAPVQVVPDHPYYVFAPFDGIVDELAVHPGEKIRKGDIIFKYDTRILEKQLEEALRGIAVARAELARLEGAAYEDKEARARIPVQKLEVERKQAEAAFLRTQLELSEVRTGADGVVVLDDPDALIGASLRTGEMVLSIAAPEHTKLKIMIPVSDAGLVQESAPAIIRLDSDPLRTLDARIERIGFDVRLSDERIPSVLAEAVWKNNPGIIPGQRGMARIQGPRVFLGLQLFRKPLITLRNVIGI